jgi:hypothetical protein
LGASVIGADGLREIPLTSTRNIGFVVLVALFFAAGLVAFTYFMLALRVQKIRTLRVDHAILEYFDRFEFATGLRGMAIGFLRAAAVVRERAQQKVSSSPLGASMR